MKRLLALSALLIPIYLFAQGFGSFSHDQPYLAADRGSSSAPACDTNSPALSTTNLYALYDFNCSGLSAGTLISNLNDLGPLAQNLSTTNAPFSTNNVAEINNNRYGRFINKYLMSGAGLEIQAAVTYYMVTQAALDSGGAVHTIFDNSFNNIQPGGFHQLLFDLSSGGYVYGGVAGIEIQKGPYAIPVNWCVTEIYWNGASSYIKTNNVTALSTAFSPSRISGTTLGADSVFSQMGNFKMAWFAAFTNTLSSTTSSNIFYYLTNRFNIQ